MHLQRNTKVGSDEFQNQTQILKDWPDENQCTNIGSMTPPDNKTAICRLSATYTEPDGNC